MRYRFIALGGKITIDSINHCKVDKFYCEMIQGSRKRTEKDALVGLLKLREITIYSKSCQKFDNFDWKNDHTVFKIFNQFKYRNIGWLTTKFYNEYHGRATNDEWIVHGESNFFKGPNIIAQRIWWTTIQFFPNWYIQLERFIK